MKKSKKLLTVLLVLLALAIGFLLGLFVDYPNPLRNDAAGTIGKVERYRNVKVTDKDIQLRNDFLSDTVLCLQYQKYLMYYYYQSLKAANDIGEILSRTTSNEAFHSIYYPYADALTTFQEYTEAARQDIMRTVALINQLKPSDNVPLLSYMNQSYNAVSRIRNHNSIMIDYMKAMDTYIGEHPEEDNRSLQQAHDIISYDLLESAIKTNDKQLLQYLATVKVGTDDEEVKELKNEDAFEAVLSQTLLKDMNGLIIWTDQEQIGVFTDSESLRDLFRDATLLHIYGDQEIMKLVNSQETMNFVRGQEQLGLLIPSYLGMSSLLDAEKLGTMFFDSEKLRLMDAEYLGTLSAF